MKPFFSIIIPTLNEERLLPNLLNDLKKQKEKKFEVLIIDGQSKDKTTAVAKKAYGKARIIISDKRNLCHQRNIGGQKAKGDYLVFLDADIRIYNNYLSELKKTIDRNSYLFITTYLLPDVRDKFDIFLIQIANYTLEIMKLANKQMAPGFNFIIYKNLFNKIGGFDERTTISEDHELSLRIQNAGVRLNIIPKRLLKWSFRRIKKDGYLPLIYKYSIATVHSVLLGEITDKKLGYQMGGHHFLEDKDVRLNKKLASEIKKYSNMVKALFKEFF